MEPRLIRIRCDDTQYNGLIVDTKDNGDCYVLIDGHVWTLDVDTSTILSCPIEDYEYIEYIRED